MNIGPLDASKKIIVIAEIGNNHEGDPALAMDLVSAAAEAGADAVKAQFIDPERLVNRSQIERLAQLKRFQLPTQVFFDMARLAKEKGLVFLSSAFDIPSLDQIAGVTAAIKIASGDLDFHPLLTKAATLDKPVILSTGMASLKEIETAVRIFRQALPSHRLLRDELALLHCVSLYPTPLEAANLRAIVTLQNHFQLTVGYSDHTIGIEAAILSLAMGARIIEKHFTLDKTRTSFRDHALSADPSDLKRLTTAAHLYEDLLGNGEKGILSHDEIAAARSLRRGVVAARDLPAGTVIHWSDLDYVRPRQGLSPSRATMLIGKKLRENLRRHDPIQEGSVS